MQFEMACGSFFQGPYEKTERKDGCAKIDPRFATNCKAKNKRREFINSLLESQQRESEAQAQSEGELAHAGRRTRRGISFDICDPALTGAIDTHAVVLVVVIPENRVIEDVKCIHPELQSGSLSKFEVLGNRSVGTKETWAAQRVIAVSAYIVDSRIREPLTAWERANSSAARVS